MTSREGFPDSFEQKIAATHAEVEALFLQQNHILARDPGQKFGQEIIDGVTYDIAEEGLYYDIAKVTSAELAGHAPTAEAVFKINSNSKHDIEIGYSPAYVTPDGEYQAPRSFFAVTNRSHPAYNDIDLFDLSDGGKGMEGSDGWHSYQRDAKLEALEPNARDREMTDFVLLSREVQLPPELWSAGGTVPAPDAYRGEHLPRHDPKIEDFSPTAGLHLAPERDFTDDHITALKEVVDFIKQKKLAEAPKQQ